MSATLSDLWPYASMLLGALASYFGASNAMRERLARMEEKQSSHSESLTQLRNRVDDAHARINRIIEGDSK